MSVTVPSAYLRIVRGRIASGSLSRLSGTDLRLRGDDSVGGAQRGHSYERWRIRGESCRTGSGRGIWGYNLIARLPGFLSFREVAMPDPTWQALYRAALVEPDPIRLNSRIDAARLAIRQRLEQIVDSRDTRERQQLDNALYALSTVAARKRSA